MCSSAAVFTEQVFMGVCPLSASRIIFQDCKKFHLICHDGSRFILVNVEPCWSLRCCRHSGQPLCSGPVCAHVEHCCPGCILEVVGTHCPGEWPRSPESCVSLSTCFLLPSRLSLQRTVCDCAEVPAEGYSPWDHSNAVTTSPTRENSVMKKVA